MADTPLWFSQLEWSTAIRVIRFISGDAATKMIAKYPGVYVFSLTDQSLRTGDVLYVGKADGLRQSLRRRLEIYLRRLGRTAGPPSKHAGCELLFQNYYVKKPMDLYVRWAGCTAPRGVEGALIQLFDPPCNNKDEYADYDDDEVIPEDYLYSVNASYALE